MKAVCWQLADSIQNGHCLRVHLSEEVMCPAIYLEHAFNHAASD